MKPRGSGTGRLRSLVLWPQGTFGGARSFSWTKDLPNEHLSLATTSQRPAGFGHRAAVDEAKND